METGGDGVKMRLFGKCRIIIVSIVMVNGFACSHHAKDDGTKHVEENRGTGVDNEAAHEVAPGWFKEAGKSASQAVSSGPMMMSPEMIRVSSVDNVVLATMPGSIRTPAFADGVISVGDRILKVANDAVVDRESWGRALERLQSVGKRQPLLISRDGVTYQGWIKPVDNWFLYCVTGLPSMPVERKGGLAKTEYAFHGYKFVEMIDHYGKSGIVSHSHIEVVAVDPARLYPLENGNIISTVNGRKVTTIEQLEFILRTKPEHIVWTISRSVP